MWAAYDRVLCRDADSLLSPREAKCVRYWETTGRVAHSMADSISHTCVLMGGMIGFASCELRKLIKCESWGDFIQFSQGYDYKVKGADQDLLNQRVLPKIHQTLTEHHMKGMPNSFRNDWHNTVPDIDMGFPEEYGEIDRAAWHIGAAGYNEAMAIAFLNQHGKDNDYYERVEKKYPQLFYWRL